jgi:hypothetical protein
MARTERPPRGLSLRADETIRVVARPSRGATFPKYLLTLGLYGFWRKRNTAVVTDRRILMGKGIINREERSIPLTRINRAKFIRRGVNSYTEIDVIDNGRHHPERIGPLPRRTARRIQNELSDHN